MADVFISYASADRDRIAPLAAALEDAGLSVWWDRQLEGGAPFSREIERELEAAGKILVAWSDASLESMWVADEATVGRDKRNLVPITVDPVRAPIGFRQIQTIDFSKWSGAATEPAFEALLSALDLSNARPSSETTPVESHHGVSLIVLPFRTISADPQDGVLATAVHEDLTTQLARVKDYFVISQSTANLYQGRDVAPSRFARELGVTYILEGSLRRGGDDIRVSAQLIEAATGVHLAALTFDRPVKDLLSLQNDLINEIVNNLGSQINLAEVRKLEARANLSPSALEHYRCARVALDQKGWNKSGVKAAIGHLESAIEADTEYAPAISQLALLKGLASVNSLLDVDTAHIKDEVMALSRRAVELDPQSSDVLGFAGCAMADVGEAEEGEHHILRAIEIDPSNAQAHAAYGWSLILQGKAAAGVPEMQAAIRISPKHPGLAFWLFGVATGLRQMGETDAAIAALERSIRFDPKFQASYILLAGIKDAAGDKEAALKLQKRAAQIKAASEAGTA